MAVLATIAIVSGWYLVAIPFKTRCNIKGHLGETCRENISITKISNNDLSWDANFAKLVEYVGENFRLPSQVDGPTTVNGTIFVNW